MAAARAADVPSRRRLSASVTATGCSHRLRARSSASARAMVERLIPCGMCRAVRAPWGDGHAWIAKAQQPPTLAILAEGRAAWRARGTRRPMGTKAPHATGSAWLIWPPIPLRPLHLRCPGARAVPFPLTISRRIRNVLSPTKQAALANGQCEEASSARLTRQRDERPRL